MESINFGDFGKAWWAEVCKKVKKATVYIDEPLCECLHWNGGVPLLFENGAVNVKEFSLFETTSVGASKKAVFLCSGPFHGTNLRILENLVKGAGLEYSVLITTANQSVHHLFRYGGREGNEGDIFTSIEEQVLQWMGNMNYTVEIFYYPVCTAHLTHDVFMTPSFLELTPLLNTDISRINEQLLVYNKMDLTAIRSTNELTFAHLPLELQVQVRQFVVNLNSIFQHLGVREDIFTIGDFSRVIGSELENLLPAKNRRKASSRKVSLVLVDRSLDLATASQAGGLSLYDQILNCMEKFSHCSSDVVIPLLPNTSQLAEAPGCLAPPFGETHNLIDSLLSQAPDDGIKSVQQQLLKVLMTEVAPGSSVQQVFERIRGDRKFLEQNCHLYQVLAAISQRCDKADTHYAKWQKKLSLLRNDPNAPSPVAEIIQLLKSRAAAQLKIEDILILLTELYSAEGDPHSESFSSEVESRLKLTLAESFLEESELSPALQTFIGVPVDEVKANRAAKRFLEILHGVAAARSHLKKYRHMPQDKRTGLLLQVLADIVDPAAPEIPDLEYKSGGLKDLLKTGFSLFVNVRKPKVADNATIILFVVGGLRPLEIKTLKDLIADKARNHQLIIGSSHLISRQDVLDFVLKKHV